MVGAGHSHATILSVQLVNLDARHHLLVTVFSDGSVVKHSVLPTFDATHVDVAEASRQLHALLIGTTLETRVQVPSRHDHVATLVREAVSVLHAETAHDRRRTGLHRRIVAGSPRSFDGVETVRQVLSILEQELLVVSLVQDMLDQGLSVAIGSEHGYEPLVACAVIVAPVTDRRRAGRRGRPARARRA